MNFSDIFFFARGEIFESDTDVLILVFISYLGIQKVIHSFGGEKPTFTTCSTWNEYKASAFERKILQDDSIESEEFH